MMPSYQLKLPLKISKIIGISDPVYTFNEVFYHIDLKILFSAVKCQLKQTTNLPSLCKGGCRQSRQEGCQKQFSATNHNFNKQQNLFSLLKEMSRVIQVTDGC